MPQCILRSIVFLLFAFLLSGCKSAQEGLELSSSERQVFEETEGQPVAIYVTNWNQRVLLPGQFDSWLYK